MSKCDVIFECHEAETAYRIRPNPDAPGGTGYQGGAVLEWRDQSDEKWGGYFFIAPEALEALGDALTQAAGMRP